MASCLSTAIYNPKCSFFIVHLFHSRGFRFGGLRSACSYTSNHHCQSDAWITPNFLFGSSREIDGDYVKN